MKKIVKTGRENMRSREWEYKKRKDMRRKRVTKKMSKMKRGRRK